MPKGSLPLIRRASVIKPPVVIRAMLPALDWVNHSEPSGAAAMPSGPAPGASGNSVTTLVDGSRRPTALVNRSVNHTVPSVAMAICRGGPPGPAVSVMTPLTGLSLPMCLASAYGDHAILVGLTLPTDAFGRAVHVDNAVNTPVARVKSQTLC